MNYLFFLKRQNETKDGWLLAVVWIVLHACSKDDSKTGYSESLTGADVLTVWSSKRGHRPLKGLLHTFEPKQKS